MTVGDLAIIGLLGALLALVASIADWFDAVYERARP